MTQTLRLGTRGSQLAVAQSGIVARDLTAATGVPVELVRISTRGDRVTDRPLAQVGGKGLFTKELEEALLDGSVDFAVHSMKDMPTDQPDGLVFGAVPERENPSDALMGSPLDDLAPGATVGTGSARRAAQIRALRPDLRIQGIRGNVDTRIRKLHEQGYDAIVLALSGLRRLGRQDEVAEIMHVDRMIPAVGQGALAIQCRADNASLLSLLAALDHKATRTCVLAERAFLRTISGGCSVPAACHARLVDGQLHVRAMYAPEGGVAAFTHLIGAPSEAAALGDRAARDVRQG